MGRSREALMEYLENNNFATSNEAARELGFNTSTITRELQGMLIDGIVSYTETPPPGWKKKPSGSLPRKWFFLRREVDMRFWELSMIKVYVNEKRDNYKLAREKECKEINLAGWVYLCNFSDIYNNSEKIFDCTLRLIEFIKSDPFYLEWLSYREQI
jgi:hypothetical protein